MIAAVKGWYAVLSALLFFIPPGAVAADNLSGAAGELARHTAAFAGKGEPVTVEWRNLSSLGWSELAEARAAFVSALEQAQGRIGEIAPVAEVRITISENGTQFLLVAEAKKGDERPVWISAWPRAPRAPARTAGVVLNKALVWQQEEQILDVAFAGSIMLVLSPSRVVWCAQQDQHWEVRHSAPVQAPKPWPRDMRGRLRVTGSAFQAHLPGVLCKGSLDGSALDCRPSPEPWVLESGSRLMLLASFAEGRNYFDGRVTTQAGARKTLPPFYSAAAAEDQGRQTWLIATVKGGVQALDSGLEPLGALADWGSDIAGTDAGCGGGTQILATRAGDAGAPDSLQAYAIVNRAPVALAVPVEFPGSVTALWTAGGRSVVAVSRNLTNGTYEAYAVTVACGS